MRDAYVVSEHDVEGVRADGDTALVKRTIGAAEGCELLEQRVIRFGPGRSAERSVADHDDVLFVTEGSGTLIVDGGEHALLPDTAAYIAAGETAVVDNRGPGDLVVVAVAAPAAPGAADAPRMVTVAFADREELRADDNRTFRYLVNEDAGCFAVTQFLGVVQPCRAPDHSHSYDEVGYIVEGRGFVHVDDESIPIGPGSCFHLSPGRVHCVENVGPGVMRILGVFYPAGDPASRTYDTAQAVATS